MNFQPKTGERCHCQPGQQRDNCPDCEGTGWRIDFRAIRARSLTVQPPKPPQTPTGERGGAF